MNHKIIVTITGLLLLTLACLSFVLSFNSLTDLARAHGVSIPQFIPLIIEGGMIVFSLSALVQNIQGHTAYRQWFLIIAASLTAMTFNVIHAQAGDIVGQVLHAIPSVILLVGFESFLSQLKNHVKTAATVKTYDTLIQGIARTQTELHHAKGEFEELDKATSDKAAKLETIQAELSTLTKERDKLTQDIDRLENRTFEAKTQETQTLKQLGDNSRKAKMKKRRAELSALWANGIDIKAKKSELAEQFNVKPKTIKRDIEALELDTEPDTEVDIGHKIIDLIPLDEAGQNALHSLRDKQLDGTINAYLETHNGNGQGVS